MFAVKKYTQHLNNSGILNEYAEGKYLIKLTMIQKPSLAEDTINTKVNKVYFDIFQKHFPDLRPGEVTALYEGNDHWVFVVRSKSFPKNPKRNRPEKS